MQAKLSDELVGNWADELWFNSKRFDEVSLTRLCGHTLKLNLYSASLGFLSLSLVFVDTLDEGGSRLGVLHVLNADVDALGDDAALDTLVDNDANGMLGHVEDTSGLSMVDFVWHTLLD